MRRAVALICAAGTLLTLALVVAAFACRALVRAMSLAAAGV